MEESPFYHSDEAVLMQPGYVLSTYRDLFYGSGAGFPTDHKFKV
jgi:hypothetical protein